MAALRRRRARRSVTRPAPERTVQGTAAKGLIKGAKVSVYALDAQGVRGAAALATAITGDDGTYKLQLAASVQNFVIEVSAAPGAVMADEASGTDIAIPESMKLRSVVTLASAATGTYEGTVSPLTEMIARTARNGRTANCHSRQSPRPRPACVPCSASIRKPSSRSIRTAPPQRTRAKTRRTRAWPWPRSRRWAVPPASTAAQSNAGRADCLRRDQTGGLGEGRSDGQHSLEQNAPCAVPRRDLGSCRGQGRSTVPARTR